MFSSARLNACTSRTAEMLSCSSALTLPISLRVLRKALRAWSENHSGGDSHDRHHHHAEQRKRHALRQHVVSDPDQQQHAAGDVDQGKVDRLADGLGVVGDAAHQVAGFMLGVVARPAGGAGARRRAVRRSRSTCCPAQVIEKKVAPVNRLPPIYRITNNHDDAGQPAQPLGCRGQRTRRLVSAGIRKPI